MRPMGKKSRKALLMAGLAALLIIALAGCQETAARPEEDSAVPELDSGLLLLLELIIWHPSTRFILIALMAAPIVFVLALILAATILMKVIWR